MNLIKANGYKDLSRKAANVVSAQVILKPSSVLGLATGSTPVGTYEQLIEWYKKGDIDFSRVVSVNLDEYCGLSPEDPQSYRYFMNDHFFSDINIKPENTHVPNGLAQDLESECIRYENLIADLGGIDLQVLGIGHNGHIGFNEPGNSFEKATHIVELNETTLQANARFFQNIDDVPKKAITMGIKSIMQSRKILLIANGPDKEEIIHKAIFGPVTPDVPASILQFHPDLTVVCSFEG
ncbi:glucosamine-6-phosphate deaminase [Anaerocolumna sp. AGMB13020]|uniref:glucosamine-6-phosphate deaminase n=1 Tax=Anaerocolumna sp. AGMB13020 TaxID=3081750 RepID=UPI002952A22A|nr:glucosamine-6-phosphate deaminase [Anaerocolumna sp. AGMB13020]WOO37386.1 glucosamine-6-phosphate deaminase [Anaerocolumna sp. AGMB13020]